MHNREQEEHHRLVEVGQALVELAKNDGAPAPAPVLEEGWLALRTARSRLVSAYDAQLANKAAELAACQVTCEENRLMLEVSEQRRLASLKAGREDRG